VHAAATPVAVPALLAEQLAYGLDQMRPECALLDAVALHLGKIAELLEFRIIAGSQRIGALDDGVAVATVAGRDVVEGRYRADGADSDRFLPDREVCRADELEVRQGRVLATLDGSDHLLKGPHAVAPTEEVEGALFGNPSRLDLSLQVAAVLEARNCAELEETGFEHRQDIHIPRHL